MGASEFEFPVALLAECTPVHAWIMQDLTGFSKIWLILLAFKVFSSPCYYLAIILLEGNELSTRLQMPVNIGNNNNYMDKAAPEFKFFSRGLSL